MSGAARGWEHFPHGADIGIRGYGPSREAAFEEAARALVAVIADLGQIAPHDRVEVRCMAPDDEVLLVDWLNALVFEMATRSMLLARFRVRIEDRELQGEAWGEPIDPVRHRTGVEVKGATYTELDVDRRPDGTWIAQCVVDV